MPWYSKEQPTPFDTAPIHGLMFLNGEVLARRFRQEWVRGKKYPVITYPSGLERELLTTDTLSIFGAFQLPRVGDRDSGLQHAIEFAQTYNYTVAQRGVSELLVFHPHTANGYLVIYDNHAGEIANVIRFPGHAMELLDGESRAVLPPLYSNEQLGLDAIAPVKFFTPDSNWTWYSSEYDQQDTFFGLVSGFEVELGYFSLTELEGVRGALGLPIERDLYYQPKTLGELLAEHKSQRNQGM